MHSSCTSRSKSGWVPSPDSCQTRSAPHLGNAAGAAQGSRAVQRGGGQQARHLGAPDLRYRDRQADPRDDEIGALAGLYGADRATRRQLAQVTADLRDEPAPACAVITRPERPAETVAADLRRRIAAEEWAVDDPLPPVGGLAAHNGVSRSTVTRAMRVLAGESLARIVPRRGTFRAGGNS